MTEASQDNETNITTENNDETVTNNDESNTNANNTDDTKANDAKIDDVKDTETNNDNNNNNSNNNDNNNIKSSKKEVSTIILMGDSVLDNFYWLKNQKLDVRQQLLNLYNNKIKVYNFAVDESTSIDVIKGKYPGSYADARDDYGLDPYPINKNGLVKPLNILSNMINSKDLDNNVNKKYIKPTVLLSVGGNDVRELLGELFFADDKQATIQNGLNNLSKNLTTIIEKITQTFKLNIIVVMCYEPYCDFAGSYGITRDMLVNIMTAGFDVLLKHGIQYGLPIIDLSRTFDPWIREHYGSTNIEPSNLSGQFIADLTEFVMNDFDFDNNTKSMVYYGIKNENKGIIKYENNQDGFKSYKNFMKNRKKTDKTQSNM